MSFVVRIAAVALPVVLTLFLLRVVAETWRPLIGHAIDTPLWMLLVPSLPFAALFAHVWRSDDRPWRLVFRPRSATVVGALLLFLATPPASVWGIPVFWPFLFMGLPTLASGVGPFFAIMVMSWVAVSYVVACLITSAVSSRWLRFATYLVAVVLGHFAALGVLGVGSI